MNVRTQSRNTIIGFVFAFVGLLGTTGLVGCEEKQPAMDAKKEVPAVSSQSEPVAGEANPAPAPAGADTVLVAPVSSPGRVANDEGIGHAQQDHWVVAEGHFRKAVEADPKLAEAQFNLGLTLDKLSKHDEAKIAFKKAAELAPGNPTITDSPILKKYTST
ncbi:MAG: tetratricopeptide repeat protein [Nitrospiraceae bacterium]